MKSRSSKSAKKKKAEKPEQTEQDEEEDEDFNVNDEEEEDDELEIYDDNTGSDIEMTADGEEKEPKISEEANKVEEEKNNTTTTTTTTLRRSSRARKPSAKAQQATTIDSDQEEETPNKKRKEKGTTTATTTRSRSSNNKKKKTQQEKEDQDWRDDEYSEGFEEEEEEEEESEAYDTESEMEEDDEEDSNQWETIDTKPMKISDNIKVLPILSLEQKKAHLEKLNSDKDLANKFLVCLMWDFEFRYTLLRHQYEGVFSVAGVDVKALQKSISESLLDDDEKETEKETEKKTSPRHDTLFCISTDGKGTKARQQFIINHVKFKKTRGLLLADDMGLGKTIQGIGGALLRLKIVSIQREAEGITAVYKKEKPTIIVCPNDEVLNQWHISLIISGVDPDSIFKYQKNMALKFSGNIYILLTRYNLQTEVKAFATERRSKLFPTLNYEFYEMMENQYLASKGKATNEYREKYETISQTIARLLALYTNEGFRKDFGMVLIDESHFLRNLEAFWGFGSAMLGRFCDRVVLLSGTPYNNSNQDMASQMTIIDAKHPSSDIYWWEKATLEYNENNDKIKDNIKDWREDFMLRRDKTLLGDTLPAKKVAKTQVQAPLNELYIYACYEAHFLDAVRKFRNYSDANNANQQVIMKMRELFTYMMALMSCMRMSLIHPIIPSGREITIQFSPTRRKLLYKCKTENSKSCVWCRKGRFPSSLTMKVESKPIVDSSGAGAMDVDNATSKEQQEEAMAGLVNDDGQQRQQTAVVTGSRTKDLGKLIPLPNQYCSAPDVCKHHIHEKCLDKLIDSEEEPTCPKCDDLKRRMAFNPGDTRMTYCKNISYGYDGEEYKGIKATSKIQQVVDWVETIPEGEKAIIYSFFKGSLDILEGILVYDLEVETKRFDGDFTPIQRSKELEDFKTSDTCKVLLVSVQSGGVGLNITEANHVLFVDRWFNPCVHAQAEDRCYRLGQKKEVSVNYFDTNMTIDEVMAAINKLKRDNASILLADGSSIGSAADNIGFKELGGRIGDMMKYISSKRAYKTSSDEIEAIGEDTLIDISEERSSIAKRPLQAIKYETKEEIKDEKTLKSDPGTVASSSSSSSPKAKDELALVPASASSTTTTKNNGPNLMNDLFQVPQQEINIITPKQTSEKSATATTTTTGTTPAITSIDDDDDEIPPPSLLKKTPKSSALDTSGKSNEKSTTTTTARSPTVSLLDDDDDEIPPPSFLKKTPKSSTLGNSGKSNEKSTTSTTAKSPTANGIKKKLFQNTTTVMTSPPSSLSKKRSKSTTSTPNKRRRHGVQNTPEGTIDIRTPSPMVRNQTVRRSVSAAPLQIRTPSSIVRNQTVRRSVSTAPSQIPDSSSSSTRRRSEPTTKNDAINYLDTLKLTQPKMHTELLKILKKHTKDGDRTSLIKSVANLFRGRNDLILGFETFLPTHEDKLELRKYVS